MTYTSPPAKYEGESELVISFRGLEKAPFAQVKANSDGTWTLKLRRTDVKPEHAIGLFALTVMYGDNVSAILEVTSTIININYKDLEAIAIEETAAE